MVLSAKVQVPSPLFAAVRLVWPPTSTRIEAVVSFTVPLRAGRLSLVTSVLTVTTGAAVSILSSLLVPSTPALPAASVAVTATL